MGILHAGVEALAADGAVHVGGIAEQEDAAHLEAIGDATREREAGVPAQRLTLLLSIAAVLFVSTFLCCGGQGESARNQAYEIAKAIQIFEPQHHRRPTSLNELVSAPRPIMQEIPLDPWGHAWLYVNPGVRSVGRVDVVSAGEDGVFFTGDDFGNWNE